MSDHKPPDGEVRDAEWAARAYHSVGHNEAFPCAKRCETIVQMSNAYAVAQSTPAIVAQAKAEAMEEAARLFPYHGEEAGVLRRRAAHYRQLAEDSSFVEGKTCLRKQHDTTLHLLAEWGGQRCTHVCDSQKGGTACKDKAHWCYLPAGHEGPHLHPCELQEENARLRATINEAVGLLVAGKRQFAPTTTNSLVDDFIAKHSTPKETKS